jgi:methionyl-tRNA synthetase
MDLLKWHSDSNIPDGILESSLNLPGLGGEVRDLSLRGKKFFLTPVCLVPNGRVHLGHIAGPLLKMDVLRRHLERAGADVRMVALSDVHESHVAIKAHVEGTTPTEIANRFHRQIMADLRALHIEYDDLINPLDQPWSGTYETINRNFLDDIINAGNSIVRSEPTPILADNDISGPAQSLRPRIGEPVVSGWLKGRCPYCDQPLVGFFCESCGGHFAPVQMVNPGTAHFAGTLRFEERPSLYLELRGGASVIVDHLRHIGVRADFLAIAERYLATNGASIRLTVASPWGLKVNYPRLEGQVMFSYSALLIGCHFVAGERYRQLTGAANNPFDCDSDVECVLSFGIDNAIPFLVGAVGCALGQYRYKPVDHFLVNYFYDLDGSKFSTSRGHVIWAGDIVTLSRAEVDLVRAYLCWRNPEFQRETFCAKEFLKFHNEFGAKFSTAINAAIAAMTGQGVDHIVLNYLKLALSIQSAFLDPKTFDLCGAFSCIEHWLRQASAFTATAKGAGTWLKGLILLAYPIMPDLSQRLWRLFGMPGMPSVNQLEGDRMSCPSKDIQVPPYRQLRQSELNACLPASLER